uniref:Autophagy-related protein n=1 Tax=viral metagenome TaxID=1070528 RepID=A0A6C0KS05_9ZZZZ
MSDLQLREGELERIRSKHPDKVPVFVTKSIYARDSLPEMRKRKFLVPLQYKMGEFLLMIRKWLLLKPDQAVFIFIENTLPMIGSTIGELYIKHKGEDGVLRLSYASENTFG